MQRLFSRLAIFAVWTALGALAGVLLAVSLPAALGYRALTEMSGSMGPTIQTGDVVLVKQVSPLDTRVGDVVTFRDPGDPARLLTHRVREIHVQGTTVDFVTKGDANTDVEHWSVGVDGTIGRVEYHIWRLGYLMFLIRSPFGRLGLVVVPALALGAFELWGVWRPRRGPELAPGGAVDAPA